MEWLKEVKKGKLARWAAALAEYDLTIQHVSGRLLAHVDAISRLVDEDMVEDWMVLSARVLACTVTMLRANPITVEYLKQLYQSLGDSERG